jgi:hypothetical protein
VRKAVDLVAAHHADSQLTSHRWKAVVCSLHAFRATLINSMFFTLSLFSLGTLDYAIVPHLLHYVTSKFFSTVHQKKENRRLQKELVGY